MTIRKAVIPAGGIGSRFLPITKTLPKEMLPIVDIPTDGEPFAVLLPDELIQSNPPCLTEMKQVYEQFSTSVVGVQKVPYEDVERYGIIAPSTSFEFQNIRLQTVEDVVEKPRREDAPSNCAVVGRYILEPDASPSPKRALASSTHPERRRCALPRN
ncbi:sugar phosphate nucleotidyltransferase [Alicyclobacillus fastidiosus]|uniref:sugar phosphate nucleotidyltransferase n=1 Tax=Alicyclobacillus fastidiosus TaxID=392011 RepID=UPI0023E9AF49|nr:sugar phosphate nucleotidyltransferase [Alicyclobacillus fastidiosus]GMA63409.1 hypothetical protein GCM10025859_38490 [Alicyclobacillus fastidiosus]